jgi:tetratricopeptide (TPR) repeat protein
MVNFSFFRYKALHRLLFTALVLSSPLLISQDETKDSLKRVLKTAAHDTVVCSTLNALIETEGDDAIWPEYNRQLKSISESNLKKLKPHDPIRRVYLKYLAAAINNTGYLENQKGNTDLAVGSYLKSLEIQQTIGDSIGISASLTNLGNMYQNKGQDNLALEYYNKGLKIQQKIGDKRGMAYSLNNLGNLYQHQGLINKGLEYFLESLNVQESIGDKFGVALVLNNIGIIHQGQGDLMKALEYYKKSYKIYEGLSNQEGMANTLNNLGVIYEIQKKKELALETYNKSLGLYQDMGSKGGVANTLGNIGLIYFNTNNIDKALEKYSEALKLQEELNDRNGISFSLYYIGGLYLKRKKYSEALRYSLRSIEISRELGYPLNIEHAAGQLSEIYTAKRDFKNALEYYELWLSMKDSISNDATRKSFIKTQLKYEYEKKASADSVKNVEAQKVKDAQLTAQGASLKQEKTQRYALYGGLILIAGFLAFVFNRFRITQKQKRIIELQKVTVDEAYEKLHEKNKEVMDSIRYAKRIQAALLTSERYIQRSLRSLNK